MRQATLQQIIKLPQSHDRKGWGHLQSPKMRVSCRAGAAVERISVQAEPPKEKTFRVKINCGFCNRIIWYPATRRRFCSHDCRKANNVKVQREKRHLTNPPRPPHKRGKCPVCDITVADHRQIHCSWKCARMSPRERSQTKNAIRMRRKRTAVLGRKCKYCKRLDSTTQFNIERCCILCQRQRNRTSCFKCEGPFYVNKSPTFGITGCLIAAGLVPGDSCKYYV